MSDTSIKYRGKPIDAMTIEELRAALITCAEDAQIVERMHQEHVNTMAQWTAQQNDSVLMRRVCRLVKRG